MILFLTKKNYAHISDMLIKYFKHKNTKSFDKFTLADKMWSSVFSVDVLANDTEYINLYFTCIGDNKLYSITIPTGSKLEFKGTTLKLTTYDNIRPCHFNFHKF